MRCDSSFLALFLLSLSGLTVALIPEQCAQNVTEVPAICCPVPSGLKLPCGYPSRGRCVLVPTPSTGSARQKKVLKNDIRADWPARVFQYVCKCSNRYWGIACESCELGFEGQLCQHRVRYKRRNVQSYSQLEKDRFLEVLTAARHTDSGFLKPRRLGDRGNVTFQNTSIYENAVYIHFFAARYPIRVSPTRTCATVDLNHNTQTFILWHRYYLLWWERNLREFALKKFGYKNFTFPYWDYTDKDVCDICTDDFVCRVSSRKDGLLSPGCKIASWDAFCTSASDVTCDYCDAKKTQKLTRRFNYKRPPGTSKRLITVLEMMEALRAPVFSTNKVTDCGSFANYIESGCSCNPRGMQMHNLVHNIFMGDMASTVASTNDPLFFLHHSQLDRLLQRWYLAAKPLANEIVNTTGKPQVCRWCNFAGFLPVVKAPEMLVDLRDVGVDYDNYDFGTLSEKISVPIERSVKTYKASMCS